MLHELTPAHSSCMPSWIGAVVEIRVDHAFGVLDPAISVGQFAGLKFKLNVLRLLFRSLTFQLIVICFSMP